MTFSLKVEVTAESGTTQGLVLGVPVPAANIRDPAGGKHLLETLQGRYSRLRHLFIDGDYKRSFQE